MPPTDGTGDVGPHDGGGLAKGGDVTLYYDGKPVGHGRVEQTQPMIFSLDEAANVGTDSGYRDRYRDMATTLGYEGHIDWAEAMP